MELRCRDRVLSLDRAAIMGVLNVTPDSFSDGGRWLEPAAAIDHAREMAAEGAVVIDVGGESTRPGATPVPEEEELRRVLPVVEALGHEPDMIISIDTRKPEVARRALDAGAAIVNDTSGEEADGALDRIVAGAGAGVIAMHSRGTPATMRSMAVYSDVVDEVGSWLRARAGKLQEAGVARDAIAVDPGFGFAKSPPQNLALLKRIDEILALGYPVVVGTSRKSFIGAILDVPEDERVEGTAATVAWAVARGCHLFRVHDVRAISRVVRMTEAISAATGA